MFLTHYPKVLVSQIIFWGLSTLIKNPTLVDVAWGANHFIIGLSILNSNGFSFNNYYIGLPLLTLWFLRLSGFIFYNRIWKPHVDPRYEHMRRNRNEILYYFFQFQIQGVLCVFTSIPLYFLFTNKSLTPLNLFGVGLCIAGIIGEALADHQLQKHKDTRTNNNSVFKGGLFKYSRHPNLFFELTFWSGISLLSVNLNNPCSLLSLSGPILLYLIMRYLTIPITTKHMMKTKPNYKEHIAESNMFWPFSPKNKRL
jgi:steroid 5-alpha reductase family enzyme